MDLVDDFRFVEIDGEAVAYVTSRWWDEVDGPRIYRHMCKVVPEWRNHGIGSAMLSWAQRRLAERAADHHTERSKVYRTDIENEQSGGAALLEADGYVSIQHGASLVRPNSGDAKRPSSLEPGSVR